ncbi:MAG: hypothetical protein K6E12_10220 [Saccharofermentans sp.]|nr:hypothetical protein [Saccharofermentans sp.]
MKCRNKTSSAKRLSAILRSNDGASIVLVTIIAIIIITGVIILRTTTGALWASADKQLYDDQAYEMATSLGNSLDVLIVKDGSIRLDTYADSTLIPKTTNTGLPNSSVEANIVKDAGSNTYTVVVEAHVANSIYIYTAKYKGSDKNYTREY